MSVRPPIFLYTDGASSGNPGPGGWGAVLCCGSLRREMSGGFARTTNNRMELLAVIEGLSAIRWPGAQVEVWSDSQYVVNTVTQGWKRKKNHDLWARFDAIAAGFTLNFHWLKGHAGHPENERCDRLAVAAYSRPGLPVDAGYIDDNQLVGNNVFADGNQSVNDNQQGLPTESP